MDRRHVLQAGLAVAGAALGGRQVSARAAGPVVLELFTSQGCSSCPPADRLLGELARDPSVIALAWHVDYWNGLGWIDPFASRQATDRQRAYAARLGEIVYTPALVVGGERMVVGSDAGAVAEAMRAAPPLPVAVTISDGPRGRVAAIGAGAAPVRALAVFYEPEHLTSVARGENGGRQLREFRIVRQTALLGEWDGAARSLALPPAPPGQGVAVLVHDAAMRMLGAGDAGALPA